MTLKVKDLKEKLQDVLDNLANYDDDQEVHTVCNTYWCNGDFMSVGSEGFVSLSEPVKQEDDDEDY